MLLAAVPSISLATNRCIFKILVIFKFSSFFFLLNNLCSVVKHQIQIGVKVLKQSQIQVMLYNKNELEIQLTCLKIQAYSNLPSFNFSKLNALSIKWA